MFSSKLKNNKLNNFLEFFKIDAIRLGKTEQSNNQ